MKKILYDMAEVYYDVIKFIICCSPMICFWLLFTYVSLSHGFIYYALGILLMPAIFFINYKMLNKFYGEV